MSYLEMKVSDLENAWNNYKRVRENARVSYQVMIGNYKKKFGHDPMYRKGLGGYALWDELKKCEENIEIDVSKHGCNGLDGRICYFFDPSDYVKHQRESIATILEVAEDRDFKVLADVDLCNFILRWRTGGVFLNKEEE